LQVVLRKDRHPQSSGWMQRVEAFEVDEVVDYPSRMKVVAMKELEAIATGQKDYLKPDQWKPVAYAATAPVNGVTLDGGPCRVAFDRNIACLNEWFTRKNQYRRPTDPKTGQVRGIPVFGWEGNLPASSEGRMLGGAGNTLRWGEREDMRAIVDALVGIVKERQRPDGYCMPFPEEHMKPNNMAWFDERRNYDRVNLTRGMMAAAVAGNKDALPVMRRFYDWLNASPTYPLLMKGIYVGASSHNGINGHEGSLLMYFSAAGKPEDLVAVERYFVQDCLIEESRKREPLSLSHYPFHTPHSYVLLAYKAWLDHYRATGAPKYLEGAQGAWQLVHDHFLHRGGSLAICEAYRGTFPPGSYYLNHAGAVRETDKGKAHTGETCGSIFWADINHRLLQFFPEEPKYADEIEQALFNVMLAAQDEKGNFRYHNQLVGRKANATFENTCCEVMGQPFIGSLPQYLYSVAADGVYVNLYAPSEITTKTLTLKTTTDFPVNGKVEIKVEGTGKLRVRIPGWVTSDPAGSGAGVPVSVNGKAVATGKPGSYVTLDRTWKKGDTVSFELPMKLRTELYAGADQSRDYERYALLYGPVLMALVGADDLDIPAKDLPGKLKPVDCKPLHFSVAGKDGVLYQPYWQIQTETFTCFPTLR
jgi:hypothetical protein